MKRFFLFLILFDIVVQHTYSQNINGKWNGFLYQNPEAVDTLGFGETWRIEERQSDNNFYPIELSFSLQPDSTSLSGTYHITADFDTSLKALFLLSGNWHKKKKSINYLTDVRKYGISAFCYNKTKFKYHEKDGFQYLEGSWEGWTSNNCGNGVIAVWRPIIIENKKEKKIVRKVKIATDFQTSNPLLTIEIWDNGYEDGDVITLKLNNKIVLANHLVTQKKYILALPLDKEGDNILQMIAINTGKQPPNTTAFCIKDGKQEKVIVLKSNMHKTEAIRIKRSRN